MKYHALIVIGILGIAVAGCSAPISKEAKQDLKKPVNCATAEGDLRVLEKEKAHASSQAVAGITAIAPIGLVAGVVSGTEGDKLKVATGEYNKQIEAKIAEIKRICKV
jgi:hypothetical protein